MLKNVPSLLSADFLYVLASMGHGDEIVLADANFPSVSVARSTIYGKALHMDCDALNALSAVTLVLPLDTFVVEPVTTMQVVDDPNKTPEVVAEAMPLIKAEGAKMASLERFAFYERTKEAFAIVRTLEMRPYGNFILRKGVIIS